MGYFSNGSQGEIFREEWCHRCEAWGRDVRAVESDTAGCAIMDVHFFYAYGAEGDAKKILDMLITRGEDGQQCQMFSEREGAPLRGQPALTGLEAVPGAAVGEPVDVEVTRR